jgi:hypothetical protein
MSTKTIETLTDDLAACARELSATPSARADYPSKQRAYREALAAVRAAHPMASAFALYASGTPRTDADAAEGRSYARGGDPC